MYFARSLMRRLAVNSTLLVIEAHVACTLDLPSSFGGKTASTAPIEFGGEKKGRKPEFEVGGTPGIICMSDEHSAQLAQ